MRKLQKKYRDEIGLLLPKWGNMVLDRTTNCSYRKRSFLLIRYYF